MRKEFFNSEPSPSAFYMVNCGYEDCAANFLRAPHIRGYYLIHYIVKGSGSYEVNGTSYPVRPGEIFIIHPGQVVSYSCKDESIPWSFCWIGFSGQASSVYLRELGIREQTYVQRLSSSSFFDRTLACLRYIEKNQNSLMQVQLTALLLETLLCIRKGNSIPARQRPDDLVKKAIQYIEFNYMKNISIRDVVDHVNLERTYFYRIFKQCTGLSPQRYLMELRIKKSIELMHTNAYTFSEIASYIGVGDVYYFSRLFKRIMGVSPSVYQKSHIVQHEAVYRVSRQ